MRVAARTYRRWAAAIVCAVMVSARAAGGQTLDVPFLPQTEALCGGAAAAMVMRYWGASDAYPDAFQPLVDHSVGGIRATALTADLTRRGWTAVAGPGDAQEVVKELGRGRPIIALIEDRPGRFHYVVVAGWAEGKVVLHDPARAPGRVLDVARFEAAWQKSDRWMLILLPGPALNLGSRTARAQGATDAARHDTAAEPRCGRLVTDAVERSDSDRAAARHMLTSAVAECRGEIAAWRELAGLDALDANWTDAAEHASRALAIDSTDPLSWRILATSRYVRHEDLSALDAWNRVAEPVVNLIDVKGLQHTRYDVVADAIGVELKSVLTADAIVRAERRVRDIPSVAGARVTFHPTENGRAQIDAAILERNRVPSGYPAIIRAGFDALTGREVSVALTNLTGGGDAAGVTWRWWAHRPMIAGFYSAPAPRGIGGGVWRLDLSRETQTFGRVAFEETRTRAGMMLGRWLSDRTRVAAGAGVERWTDRANDVTLDGAVEHWAAGNRVRLKMDVSQAVGADAFTTAGVSAAARSTAAADGFVVFGVAGYRAATEAAPASMWPGADTGHARDVLLRAHPLLEDGIVTGGAFGRRLAFGTVEAQRWTLLRRLPVRVAPAVFVDFARATRGLDPSDARLQADAGAGMRLALPGAGVMRIDLARGVRDGGFVLSAAWDARWK